MVVSRKVRVVSLLFVLLAAGSVSGQPTRSDSLRQQLATMPADTNRVLLLSTLSLKLNSQDAVQALAYAQQGLALAQRLHYRFGKANCLNALAEAAFVRQDYLATTRYYQQAVREAEQEPRAVRQLTTALTGLGQLAAQQEEFLEADNYFRLALLHMQRHPQEMTPMDLVVAQSNLATLYLGWLLSGRPAPDSLTRLHEHYARLGLATFRQLPPAEQRLHGDKLAFCLNSMALLHQRARRYDSAFYYQAQALRLLQHAGNKYGMVHAQQAMAEVRLAQHRWAEAAQLARPTIAWARQLHSSGYEANGSQLLAEALDNIGQGHEAYQLARAGQALADSLNSVEQRTALARLRVQFETERQRNKVRALTQRTHLQRAESQKQRQQLVWLGALLLAVAAGLAASGTLAWRLRRSRALLAHQHAEMTATRAEQDRLYGLIAHDMRGPVLAFDGLADLLTRYVESRDIVRLERLSRRVREATHGLRSLLENLLSWARTQRGELIAMPEPLAIATLLTEAATLYQPSADAGGVTLHVPTAHGYVLADSHMTRTVLRNLLGNALQATPSGGTIILSAAPGPNPAEVELRVSDTGSGLTAADIARLLGPPTISAEVRTGLGLRLCQAFATAQHGQLDLRSTIGQGTTAVLTLPQAPGI
jgi:signal transduction histidine kinase